MVWLACLNPRTTLGCALPRTFTSVHVWSCKARLRCRPKPEQCKKSLVLKLDLFQTFSCTAIATWCATCQAFKVNLRGPLGPESLQRDLAYP